MTVLKSANGVAVIFILWTIWLGAFLINPSNAQQTSADPVETAVATGARLGGNGDRTRFVADITKSVEFSITLLDEPYRVIVDMPHVEFSLPKGLGTIGHGLVKRYRYGPFAKGKARIVMDTSGPVEVAQAFVIQPVNGQPARLVIDLAATDAAKFATANAFASQALEAIAAPEEPTSLKVAEAPEDEAPSIDVEALINEMRKAAAEAEKHEAEAAAARIAALTAEAIKSHERERENLVLPKEKPNIGKQASELLEPARPRERIVVIDAGHGGVDPGAISRRGTKEKLVTLAFSKVLRDKLVKTGRYKVYLTRSGDRFIRLRDRVTFARHKKAGLFIAVHADSIRRGKARGATVYTLSERASDREAASLARKENQADVIAGVDLGIESKQVSGILINLAQRETNNHSMFFARKLSRRIGTVSKLTRKPIRSAGFRVLKAPDVPSVLLELGYLSSASDEKNLVSPAWRSKMASTMVGAIDAFFSDRIAQNQ
ncbi:MAG: N-acetylmuramoyl-L-alanine amidase [Hyphomicrobiales bacterium]